MDKEIEQCSWTVLRMENNLHKLPKRQKTCSGVSTTGSLPMYCLIEKVTWLCFQVNSRTKIEFAYYFLTKGLQNFEAMWYIFSNLSSALEGEQAWNYVACSNCRYWTRLLLRPSVHFCRAGSKTFRNSWLKTRCAIVQNGCWLIFFYKMLVSAIVLLE